MLDPVRPSIPSMFLEMSHRQLLEAGSTLQTRHHMFGDALPPIDSFWWCLWRFTSNDPIRVFLGLQCFETGIGLLEGLVHVLWW
jgi:hypothetical protein